jgi:hypothetical protein
MVLVKHSGHATEKRKSAHYCSVALMAGCIVDSLFSIREVESYPGLMTTNRMISTKARPPPCPKFELTNQY